MKVAAVFGFPVEGVVIEYMLRQNKQPVEYLSQVFSTEEAVRLISSDNPDLILLHLDEREEDAFELASLVQTQFPWIGILAISAREDFDLLLKSLRFGCWDYLLKPYCAKDLNNSVNCYWNDTKRKFEQASNGRTEGKKYVQARRELVQEMFYGEADALEKKLNAFLECFWNGDEQNYVQEMIAFAFETRHFEGISEGEDGYPVQEQQKILQEMNLNLITGLYREKERKKAEKIFVEYVRKFHSLCRKNTLSNSYRLVEMSKRVIERRVDEKLSLDKVAGEIYISPYYLCRIFKKHTGINFGDYVIECKIRESKKLLLSTDDNIDEIALRVGYDEPNSFRRMFKKHVGISPGNYRSRNHSKQEEKDTDKIGQ